MSRVTSHMSISVDGFVAGPDQSEQNPLGIRGIELHQWHLGEDKMKDPIAKAMADHLLAPKGAYVMGRNMFGPIRGEWEGDWRGWWGDEPPYPAPGARVFVRPHHEREPVEMEGGTTFHFVTGGFDEAFAQAQQAAGDEEIDIAGGASAVRQALAAGVVDELVLDIAPVVLGAGERMFDETTRDVKLELVETLQSTWASHVRYAVTTCAPASASAPG